MAQEEIGIKDLVQDDNNFNKGTARGKVLLERSFERLGAGRSVLIDKNNRLIAGNKSALAAEQVGISKVKVIETTGDEIIAVKRVDLDLDSKEGRDMALADNMTSKENTSLDYNAIMQAVESVSMDAEIWGIKDLDKLVAKEDNDLKKKETDFHSLNKAKNLKTTPIKFGRYTINPSQEEFDALNQFADDYFEENGVVIGLIAELLNI